MDRELLPGSGFIVPDQDPAKYERADKKNVFFCCEFWNSCTVGLYEK